MWARMDATEGRHPSVPEMSFALLEPPATGEEVRAYKTELDPNNVQRTALLQHAGAARFAYNWGLARKKAAREAGEKVPSAIGLHRELNRLKKMPKEQGGFPWMYLISKCAMQEALRNLDNAFFHFFRRCKTKVAKKGFPKCKKRHKRIGSFSLTGSVRAGENRVKLPRLGVLRLKETGYLPTAGVKVTRATVSERAGRWFVSLQVEQKTPNPKAKEGEILGVDVGVKHLAVLSDGTVFENPRALKGARERLRMLEKQKSRRMKGGRNRWKTVRRLSRQHYRIFCIRNDAAHKATSEIVRRASIIGIESLNVAGMLKNHCLAGAIADAGLGEFHRQLRYKMAWAGGTIVEASRWFPSSKMCSVCGHVLDMLPLSVREWDCPQCGAHHDRDVNAAINLRNLAGSSPATACCPDSSGLGFGPSETVGWAGTEHQISQGGING